MIYSNYTPLHVKESVSDISYTHLTKTELVFIEEYYHFSFNGQKIGERFKRGHEKICLILRRLKKGLTAIEIHLQYLINKGNCSRKKIKLLDSEV